MSTGYQIKNQEGAPVPPTINPIGFSYLVVPNTNINTTPNVLPIIIMPAANQGNGDDILVPSLTTKFKITIIMNQVLKVEGYSAHTKRGNIPVNIVINAMTGKLSGCSVNTPLGVFSIGADGSITQGNGIVAVGNDAFGNIIMDVSMPWFNEGSFGTRMTFNMQPWENIGNALKFIKYTPMPMPIPMPYYLLPIAIP